MKKETLLSYTYDFLSILFEKKDSDKIRKIVLHGSVARDDFDKNSDIDIFIDTIHIDAVDKITKSSLNAFQNTINKKWSLKNIDIPISAIVGDLDSEKWKNLREEMASNSILLHGNSGIMPKNISHNYMVSYSMNNLGQNEKMRLIRTLFGYSTKVNKKTYVHKGLIHEIDAEKIDNAIIIEEKYMKNLLDTLKKHKVKYRLEEVWMPE